jgi:hypothetical protein
MPYRRLASRLPWAAAFVAVTLCAAAAADDWKTYRYPQDRFAADFPMPPAPQDQKTDPQKIIRHTQYWTDKGDIAFGVSAAHYPHKIVAADTPDKFLRGVVERVNASLQCSVRSQRDLSLPGAVVREVVFEKCRKISANGGVAKQRVVLAGDWLYQVMVLSTKPGAEDSGETKRFLESFSLTAK